MEKIRKKWDKSGKDLEKHRIYQRKIWKDMEELRKKHWNYKKKDGKNMKNIWQYMEKILEKCGKA